jgi:outer membrane biosynthesis protein TonB
VGKGALAPCPPFFAGGHAEFIIGRAFARPVGFAHPAQAHCLSLTPRRIPLSSAPRQTLGDDMDDEKSILEQATDAMSSVADATKQAAKTAVKKVKKAVKKVAKKVTPKKTKKTKKAAKKSSAKKSAKKAVKKSAKKKKKKAKKSKR